MMLEGEWNGKQMMCSSADSVSDDQAMLQFFGGYFHQDWDLDHSTWESVLAMWMAGAKRDDALAMACNIDSLLARQTGDELLAETLEEHYGCCYWAGSASETRKWLQNVSAALRQTR